MPPTARRLSYHESESKGKGSRGSGPPTAGPALPALTCANPIRRCHVGPGDGGILNQRERSRTNREHLRSRRLPGSHHTGRCLPCPCPGSRQARNAAGGGGGGGALGSAQTLSLLRQDPTPSRAGRADARDDHGEHQLSPHRKDEASPPGTPVLGTVPHVPLSTNACVRVHTCNCACVCTHASACPCTACADQGSPRQHSFSPAGPAAPVRTGTARADAAPLGVQRPRADGLPHPIRGVPHPHPASAAGPSRLRLQVRFRQGRHSPARRLRRTSRCSGLGTSTVPHRRHRSSQPVTAFSSGSPRRLGTKREKAVSRSRILSPDARLLQSSAPHRAVSSTLSSALRELCGF